MTKIKTLGKVFSLALLSVLMLAVALSFAGCGDKKDDDSKTATEYTITFVVDGQTNSTTKVANGDIFSFPEMAVSDTRVFDGWYTSSDYTGTQCYGANSMTYHENVTFYGHYVDYIKAFKFSDSGETITGITNAGRFIKDLKVPSKNGETTVTAIADNAFNTMNGGIWMIGLTSVTIPSSIKSIGESAFENCNKIETLTFETGSQLTSIGDKAFRNLLNLEKITIPSGVTSISEYAFDGCKELASVTFESGSQLASISEGTFWYCSSLKNITIPKTVTSIGDYAFYQCGALETVAFESGSNLTSVGYATFMYCRNLTSAQLPNGVANVGAFAFTYCSALQTLTLPSSVSTVGAGAFANCAKLQSMVLPEGVGSIENTTFLNCTSLTSVTIPDSVLSIGMDAFYGCSSLTDVGITLESKLTTIGDYAFHKCTSLESMVIPASVTSIGSHAYKDCEKFATVYYGGYDSWYLVKKATNTDPIVTAECYYYCATTPTGEDQYWHYVNGVPTIWEKK